MAWLLLAFLVGTFILLIVLNVRRNRRMNSDSAWHGDRYTGPKDTSGRVSSTSGIGE